MARPLPADMLAFARVLAALPNKDRHAAAKRILADANGLAALADGQDKRIVGSDCTTLWSILLREGLPPLVYGDDPDFLDAMRIVAESVLNHIGA